MGSGLLETAGSSTVGDAVAGAAGSGTFSRVTAGSDVMDTDGSMTAATCWEAAGPTSALAVSSHTHTPTAESNAATGTHAQGSHAGQGGGESENAGRFAGIVAAPIAGPNSLESLRHGPTGALVTAAGSGVADNDGGGAGICQPAGGATSTMLPHFGQPRICPMAAVSRTFSLLRQVVQAIEKSSTRSRPSSG